MAISPVASLSLFTASDYAGSQPSSGAPAPVPSPSPSAQPANTAQDTTAAQPQDSQPASQQVDQAIRQANDAFTQRGSDLYAAFERDKETGISIVKIVDKRTNETIVQMPPKAVVAFAQSVAEAQNARGQLLSDVA